MTNEQMAELAARLHDFGKAYPVEIFPEITNAERAEHGRLITRAAAQMGRHFAKFSVPAADMIESAAKRVPLSDDPTPEFAKWVRDNLPAGTVIGDPDWWVPRLWRAVRNSSTDRHPLSDEEIWALWQFPADLSWKESVIRLAHAVEQAHGIRSEK